MNYTELVDASKAYADRQDIEVDNNIDTFIFLTEARVNRILKTREQTARAYVQAILDQEYYALPIDYRGMRDIQANVGEANPEDKTRSYEYLAPSLFNERSNQPYAGRHYYTIIANQIQIFPTLNFGNTIEIVYYQKVPNLNTDKNTNWLSEEHPDVYVSGIVSEIESFAKNYDVSKKWLDRMTNAISEIKSSDIEERWSGSPLRTKICQM